MTPLPLRDVAIIMLPTIKRVLLGQSGDLLVGVGGTFSPLSNIPAE